ncbi:hypothetical protein Ancab_038715, partial [Ancistrocladus abbreviatus]
MLLGERRALFLPPQRVYKTRAKRELWECRNKRDEEREKASEQLKAISVSEIDKKRDQREIALLIADAAERGELTTVDQGTFSRS